MTSGHIKLKKTCNPIYIYIYFCTINYKIQNNPQNRMHVLQTLTMQNSLTVPSSQKYEDLNDWHKQVHYQISVLCVPFNF